jgi:hypothetical protein
MTNNEKQPICALGLDALNVGGKFEKIDNIDKNVEEILKTLQKQNSRIGRLERWRTYILGGLSATLFFIGIIVAWMVKNWALLFGG